MSRLRARDNTFSVSLFPFLAVLLCTMGALILLLIIISRTARAQAKQSLDSEDAVVATQDLEAERELLELRIDQLTEQRTKTQEDLRRRQLELGHLETEAQRMRAQLDELIATKQDLDKNQSLSAQARTELEFELSRKQGEIARKRIELDQLRRTQAGNAPSYAVVPYAGPNGTNRPPIYIECRADAIILQPEGIHLTEHDFEGPLGPGNPLAAAMRATREHMARGRRSSEGETGEPYPMLLVRPDGIDAYWVAREALQSWGTDFGYELVDADWDLAYRDRDPELAREVTQAVEVAREQQRLLAQMAPRTFGRSARVFRANPSGGGVISDGSGGRGGTRGAVAGRGSRGERGGFGSGGSAGHESYGSGGEGPLPPEEPLGGGGLAQSAGHGYGGGEITTNPYADEGQYDAVASGQASGGGGQPSQYGQPGQIAQFGQQGSSAMAMAGQPGTPGSPANHSPLDTAGSRRNATGSPSLEYREGSQVRSVAERRGKNWGVPEAARGATPVTRPILLQCRSESISILSSDGRSRPVSVIAFGPSTEESVDPLIAAVWKQIETWGIAGSGMYWHPILVLDVQPGGQQRASDLEALLSDSGITVQRRGSGLVAEAPAWQTANPIR
jgi:hypothetical protein